MRALVALGAICALALVACDGGGASTSTPARTLTSRTSSAAPTPTAPPGSLASVLATVGTALGVVTQGDRAALASVMDFTQIGCITTPVGLDAKPLCTVGQRAGTLVDGFPGATCEGTYVPRERAVGELFDQIQSRNTYVQLYAVYRAADTYYGTGFFAQPRVDAVAVMMGSSVPGPYPWALLFRVDRIVGYDGSCSESLSDFLATRRLDTLLEPPATRHADIVEVDAIIDAVLSGDPARLQPFLAFENMACTATPQGIGPFYCNEGEADGTVVGVVPTAQCEGSFLRQDEPDRLYSVVNPMLSTYAVYTSDGAHSIVFQRTMLRQTGGGVLAINVRAGRVTLINFGCAETPAQAVERVPAEDFVLPPP